MVNIFSHGSNSFTKEEFCYLLANIAEDSPINFTKSIFASVAELI